MEYLLLLTAAEFGYNPGELGFVAVENGYIDPEEQRALAIDMVAYSPPYKCTIQEHLKWCEFCRALRQQDFSEGDKIVLNEIHFEVKG